MKKILFCLCAAALTCVSRPSPPGFTAARTAQPAFQVTIKNFRFSPSVLTVPPGATVTWTNQDEEPHTVVSSDGERIQSKALETNQSFNYTFAHLGSYSYFCSVHPMMTGRIIVKPPGKR